MCTGEDLRRGAALCIRLSNISACDLSMQPRTRSNTVVHRQPSIGLLSLRSNWPSVLSVLSLCGSEYCSSYEALDHRVWSVETKCCDVGPSGTVSGKRQNVTRPRENGRPTKGAQGASRRDSTQAKPFRAESAMFHCFRLDQDKRNCRRRQLVPPCRAESVCLPSVPEQLQVER
jgi:hypothetical protein